MPVAGCVCLPTPSGAGSEWQAHYWWWQAVIPWMWDLTNRGGLWDSRLPLVARMTTEPCYPRPMRMLE